MLAKPPPRLHKRRRPDVLPALNELHRLDLKLGVISNWDERLRPLLERLQLAKHFQVVIVSIELGAHKPEPEIFREASKRLGLPPRSILHIGDSELEDYQGAKRAGFDALRIDRRGPSDSQRFSSLAQMGERCQALRN